MYITFQLTNCLAHENTYTRFISRKPRLNILWWAGHYELKMSFQIKYLMIFQIKWNIGKLKLPKRKSPTI